MKRTLLTMLPAVALCSSMALAQSGTATQSAEPFKVGTFGIDGEETVGIILKKPTKPWKQPGPGRKPICRTT